MLKVGIAERLMWDFKLNKRNIYNTMYGVVILTENRWVKCI